MPRMSRTRSATGIYHVLARGVNRQEIFYDDEDYHKYLETLIRIKDRSDYEILGYCLMGNHIHLLIKEGREGISRAMHRIGTSYAWWYNRKYDRSGHLFQNRFASECVENEPYLLAVIRYIHHNPVNAGISLRPELYRWSSCRYYFGERDYLHNLTQRELILSLFSDHTESAISRFRSYIEEGCSDQCLDYKDNKRINDEKLNQMIISIIGNRPIQTIRQMDKRQRDEALRKIKQIEGSTLRQISRLTGIGLKVVHKA
ncbi:transposase [hydrocarbon metagenome]|uniref:Transposase n=1 Tax=hydrocarbon metagenome TaxID=938273 RepID=A0A0W8E1Q1_9ZZZZ